MNDQDLLELLEFKTEQYNNHSFILNDPISIPHQYSVKQDIEIAAFLTAIISWGQRTTIIKNAQQLMSLMDESPYDFVKNHKPSDLVSFKHFKHRTFKGVDCRYFIFSLKNLLKKFGSLENAFINPNLKNPNLFDGINYFRDNFFSLRHEPRTLKHISNIEKGSTGKRLNMFLRWMVRDDKKGVDFGIWKNIKPSELYLPLDVHTANASRKLGLLERKSHDWKAVLEVTQKLREFDTKDPIKYDFALFGLSRYDNI